jgi:DNA-binding response OmpR family regulator
MSARILVVEDELDVLMIVSDLLRAQGHFVAGVAHGTEGLSRALAEPFDLLILDVMLPGTDGFEICHMVREKGFEGAILMLTARAQVRDRVQGLQGGADDYLIKPFDPTELLARVGALLRRIHKEQLTPVSRFEFGSVKVDFGKLEVTRNGARVSLAAKEWQLLRHFIDHRGEVLTRDRLLQRVWSQQPYITPRTVDTHIAWLRQKLEDDPQTPKHLITVRGEGYRFER